MNQRLNAFGYPFAKDDYKNEFEKVLSKIIVCYNLMSTNKVDLTNDENTIRNYMLYNYLKTQWFKKQYGLTNYLFDPELPEKAGRIDIRVISVNPLINDDAFYVIECKRLNANNLMGKTGLNAQYISEGMYRFTSKKYSSYFGISGMIGFIVEPLDILQNTSYINQMLQSYAEINTTQNLQFQEIDPDFKFSFCSKHNVDANSIVLYHLMFDFSKNIQ